MLAVILMSFLTWTAPDKNVDGTPLDPDDINGYQLWCGLPGEPKRQVVKTWRTNHHPGWVGTGGLCCKVRTVVDTPDGRVVGPFTPELCVALGRAPDLEGAE